MVGLYMSHILSYIGYRPPAIYHAISILLCNVDRIQQRFVSDLGLTDLDALVHFKFAPLASQRDTALLGLIHCTVSDLCNSRNSFARLGGTAV